MRVEAETPDDLDAIAGLHRAAFGGEYEAAVVAGLRADGFAVASLVVRAGGQVVGHVMWSRVEVTTPAGAVPAVALAPLAVDAAHRRHGVGAALVQAGIARVREAGFALAVVLGDPAYYRRFGFAPTTLDTPYSPGKVMLLALDGAPPAAGSLRYPPPFTRAQPG